MAGHPFEELKAEYERLLATVRFTREQEIDQTARKLLDHLPRYQSLSTKVGIPAVFIAAIHERESSANFNTNLGQGDSLARPSVHVPKGRPPLGAPPNDHFPVSWEYAAEDALRLDHIDDNSAPWSMAYACWKGEIYNGFGARNHGRYTGYLWAGTNV
jgi:lysozyme family protein